MNQLLLEDCSAVASYMEAPFLPAYKISIIAAFANYVKEVPARSPTLLGGRKTSETRFTQLSRLVHALTSASLSSQHPSALLSECDAVLASIGKEEASKSWLTRAWSPSSLKKGLAPAVERQWIPILLDTRSLLFRSGTALLCLGSSCVIGRLAFLYPLTRVAMEGASLVSKVSLREGQGGVVAPSDIIRLAQSLVVMYASSVALSYLLIGFFYGYCCVLAGGALLAVRSSDAACKAVSGPVAAIGVPLVEMATAVQRIVDGQTVAALAASER
jgi:hypothetical protein